MSSCIGVFGTRIASFCVESDEELASQGNANDHFLFAGLEQPVAELSEAFVVSRGNDRDEEEDGTHASAAAAGGALSLPLATVIGDRGETDKFAVRFRKPD